MDEEEIVKLVKERVAGRSVGRGCETNEGEVKKKKKNIERDLSKAFLGLLTLYEFSPNIPHVRAKNARPLYPFPIISHHY